MLWIAPCLSRQLQLLVPKVWLHTNLHFISIPVYACNHRENASMIPILMHYEAAILGRAFLVHSTAGPFRHIFPLRCHYEQLFWACFDRGRLSKARAEMATAKNVDDEQHRELSWSDAIEFRKQSLPSFVDKLGVRKLLPYRSSTGLFCKSNKVCKGLEGEFAAFGSAITSLFKWQVRILRLLWPLRRLASRSLLPGLRSLGLKSAHN